MTSWKSAVRVSYIPFTTREIEALSLISKGKESQLSLQKLRSSAAELMACAVLELFPETLLVKGEAYDLGFYYDFVFQHDINEQMLVIIEDHMRAIIKEKRAVDMAEMMRENAIQFFRDKGQNVKAEVLEAVHENIVEIFRMGEFMDICSSPYISHSKQITAFRLQKIAQTNVILPARELRVTRIKGTVFHDKAALKKFLKSLELAKKRDHRILGRELSLFGTQDCAGAGFWFWYPNGVVIRDVLMDWWKQEHRGQRYKFLITPIVEKYSLVKEAGYFDAPEKGRNIFPPFALEDDRYVLSPSRSHLHALVFRSKLHSYRELPLRYAECGNLYTNARSAQLRGMLKSRAYCSDDAHVFCTLEQVRDEVISSLQFIDKTVKIFGFEYKLYLAVRSRKSAGPQSRRVMFEKMLVDALAKLGFEYEVDETGTAFGGAVVYVKLKDVLGREWSGPHVGIDFDIPERFGLRYQGADGEMHTPVMIARSMFGSFERFIAILVEQYGGLFPLWLAPEQVRIIPVTEGNEVYAGKLRQEFESQSLRVSIDYRQEKLGAKIRTAQCDKIPYTIVVGDEEESKRLLTVRLWNQKDTWRVGLEAFIERLLEEVSIKKIMISAS